MNACIQPRYAAPVRCAAPTVVARSTHRRRPAGPPPGGWLAKSTMRNGWLWAMATMSSGSRGSICPLRSCALAVAESPILLGAAGIDPPDVDPGLSRAEARDDGRGVDGGQTAAELVADCGSGHHQVGAEGVVRRRPERQQVRGREASADQIRA